MNRRANDLTACTLKLKNKVYSPFDNQRILSHMPFEVFMLDKDKLCCISIRMEKVFEELQRFYPLLIT